MPGSSARVALQADPVSTVREAGARWALIDARGGDVTMRVAGLPLIARQLRTIAQKGWAGAVILADGEGAEAVRRAIRQAPPPAELAVEIRADAPASREYVPLDGCAIYAGPVLAAATPGVAPQPMIAVHDPADRRAAEKRLYHSLRKSIELDGAVAYWVMRPISRAITRLLIDTPITPNQVTLLVLFSGLVSGWFAAQGGYTMCALAGAIYWLGTVVDCVDGELARLRVKGSRIGEWLDTIADDVTTYGLLAGLGIGLAAEGQGDWWLVLGLVGAIGGVAIKALMYWDLHRQRLPIDPAQYPWWFGDPTRSAEDRRRGPLARLWYYFEFVLRRDGYCTLVTIALFLGGAKAAAVGLAIGGLAAGPVLITHFVVMAFRKR
jgi:phosphatidylglycerophosphate synthase